MRTLYVRNVPDDVAAKLERLAASAGMSLSMFTVSELTAISRRADNAALLAELPDLDIDTATIVTGIEDGRSSR